jgi:hypothetical protein
MCLSPFVGRPNRRPDSSSTTSPAIVSGKSDVTHGTRSGYNNGCRCPFCTEANTAASRSRRQRIAGRSERVRTLVRQPICMPTVARTTTPLPRAGPTSKRVLHGPRLLRASAAQPPRSLFGKRPIGRTRDDQSAARDDWDTYARLLKLYLAGMGPSPSLLALKDEIEAY